MAFCPGSYAEAIPGTIMPLSAEAAEQVEKTNRTAKNICSDLMVPSAGFRI
jgi:hypothetical protein